MLTLLKVEDTEKYVVKTYKNQFGCTVIVRRPKLSKEEYDRRLEEVKAACSRLMKKKLDMEGWD